MKRIAILLSVLLVGWVYVVDSIAVAVHLVNSVCWRHIQVIYTAVIDSVFCIKKECVLYALLPFSQP